MINRCLLFFIAVVLLAGCNKQNQTYDKRYFDFDSLINVQVTMLSKTKPTLTKIVMLDGKKDQSSQVADSALLAQELDVFRQLDLINKPLYSNTYEILDGERDTRSNLRIRRYKAKTPSPIAFVTFYYHTDFKQIKKIESVYQETNSLYATSRQLEFNFDDSTGVMLLSSYKLKGSQKMILSDSVQFSIEASFASVH
jgi:hypothetical protein